MDMNRHDSATVISALQMDYGDSDEEENDSKNTSRNNPEELPFSENSESAMPDTENEKEDSESVSMTNDSDRLPSIIPNPSPIPNPAPEVEESIPKDADDSNTKQEREVSPAELISDDEDGDHSHHHHHKKHHHDHTSNPSSQENKRLSFMEGVNTDSPSSQGSTQPGRKATRLVSYGPDEDVDEDSSSEEEDNPMSANNSPEEDVDPSILSRSVQNMSNDDIKIPPEPAGKCSYQLQKKIEDMYGRMRREGLDLNRVIQSKKNFRNPSIYDKLIDFCHIDEKGTNFPPEIYDPHIWGKESFYDELDKAQRKDMERREKEKKERTKIEFMTGTKKSGASDSGSGPSDEKKRRTKWDAQPAGVIQVSKMPSASQNPGVVNLTAIATGTKATVIPAVGSLSKKPSSGK